MIHGKRSPSGWAGFRARQRGFIGLPLIGAGGGPYGVDVGDAIANSVRFNSADSPKLQRTPSSYTNNLKYTVFCRVKRSKLGTTQSIWGVHNGVGTNAGYLWLKFNSSDQLFLEGWSTNWRISSRVFRDVGKFYNIQLDIDTATGVAAADKIRISVNGVRMADSEFGTLNNPADNAVLGTDTPAAPGMRWGTSYIDTLQLDGYLCTAAFVDGQNPAASTFVRTSADTGAVVPKTPSGITWGTSGALLEFKTGASASDLGTDTSGNGNTFTVTNLSVTAGAGNDWLADTPTNTYCTLNPIAKLNTNVPTYTQGALTMATVGNPTSAVGTMEAFSGSYWECTVDSIDSPRCYCGIVDAYSNVSALYLDALSAQYSANGEVYFNGSATSYGVSYTNGDTIGVAYKDGKVWFRKNGGAWLNSGDPVAGTGSVASGYTGSPMLPYVGYNTNWTVNFGQRAFRDAPPTGFVAICTANMPTPAIGATAATRANRHFDVHTRAGTSAIASVTGKNMAPDVLWSKSLSATHHRWFHNLGSMAGVKNKELSTSQAIALGSAQSCAVQSDAAGYSFSDGSTTWHPNTSGENYADWFWKMNGAGVSATVTGGITSATRSTNVLAGQALIRYRGNAGNGTIAHGLAQAPEIVIVKSENAAAHWYMWFKGMAANTYLRFNAADGTFTDTTVWNNTVPSSTVISIGTNAEVNTSGHDYVVFCAHSVPGYSRIAKYTGNGLSDGPLVATDFEPRFIYVRQPGDAGQIEDTARTPYNQGVKRLYANSSAAEDSSGAYDILSNGFKPRGNDSAINSSSVVYNIYLVGKTPFKFSNAR